ncbi:MAG: hypothetical protein QGF16_13825 [Rhodospirillales bacterium]|jgi:hypothetical protein|nr:hypothetical protein [Rhodospirillales bacterium]
MTDDTTNDIDDDGGAKSGLLADYMDDAEFAREMGVAPRTIQRWDRLGEGPPITRIGRKKYRHRPTARKWLLGREVVPAVIFVIFTMISLVQIGW